ncbi:hypothetical protein LV779_26635 [Streptomyces thinghirensis]|nr:hypothetical protein [Streptomyces thinghirensis]
MEAVTFGVLGSVTGRARGPPRLALKGPRHRAVPARFLLARRRVVPLARLVEDLWDEPPPRAVGAVRTSVGDLRRALEPGPPATGPRPGCWSPRGPRPPCARHRRPWTRGASRRPSPRPTGCRPHRRRTGCGRRWGRAGARSTPRSAGSGARGERSRLTELRLRAVERRAELLVELGRAAEAVPDLDAHLTEHPRREEAPAPARPGPVPDRTPGGRLAVLRRARALLAGQLGVDPGPWLRRLEAGILAQDPGLTRPTSRRRRRPGCGPAPPRRTTARCAAGAHARLESTVGLLRLLAVTGGGGLEAAREHRTAVRRGGGGDGRRGTDGPGDRRLRRARQLDPQRRP